MKVALVINKDNKAADNHTEDIIAFLHEHDISCDILINDYGSIFNKKGRAIQQSSLNQNSYDYFLVLGGDGTLLSTTRALYQADIPFLGINLGRLGFLTALEKRDILLGLQELLDGKYNIQARCMLQAKVTRKGKIVTNQVALNDFVVSKSSFSRLVCFDIWIDGEFVEKHRADGIIVATPTGSTAYSLSAGGPVVAPSLNAIILTPICPHTLNARPLVVAGEAKVQINIKEVFSDIMLTADGQNAFPLQLDDKVSIEKLPTNAKLIYFDHMGFFKVLREKMGSGNHE
ncbi:MAG: NAD(+)/NADH kinase [Clostridia bacterium]